MHNVAGSLVQRKSLKQAPLQELDSLLAAWVKQTRGSNATISDTTLREKALHIATRLVTQEFKASKRWIDGFKKHWCCVQNCIWTVQKCGHFSSEGEWRKYQLLHMKDCGKPRTSSQDSQCPSQDSTSVPPKYKSRALP
jgi:hypothetical protein